MKTGFCKNCSQPVYVSDGTVYHTGTSTTGCGSAGALKWAGHAGVHTGRYAELDHREGRSVEVLGDGFGTIVKVSMVPVYEVVFTDGSLMVNVPHDSVVFLDKP